MTIDWSMILFLFAGFGLGYGVRASVSRHRLLSAGRAHGIISTVARALGGEKESPRCTPGETGAPARTLART
jgi:hypothetical protein